MQVWRSDASRRRRALRQTVKVIVRKSQIESSLIVSSSSRLIQVLNFSVAERVRCGINVSLGGLEAFCADRDVPEFS